MDGPPAPKVRYEDAEYRGHGIVIVGSLLCAVVIFCVSVRLWTRFVILRQAGPDDYLMIVATLTSIGILVVASLGCERYGWGRHIKDIGYSYAVPGSLSSWLLVLLYVICSSCIKLSVLLFCQRILARSIHRTLNWMINITLVIIALYMVAVTLAVILTCRPPQDYWLSNSPTYDGPNNCFDLGNLSLFSAIFSVVTDFTTTLIPLLALRHLHMPKRKKWALRALFSLSFIVCVAGAIRAVFNFYIQLGSGDFTWWFYLFALFTVLEVELGIICACGPSLKPLFSRTLGSTTYGSGGRLEKHYHRSTTADGRFGPRPDDASDGVELNKVEVGGPSSLGGGESVTSLGPLKVPGNGVLKSVTVDVSSSGHV